MNLVLLQKRTQIYKTRNEVYIGSHLVCIVVSLAIPSFLPTVLFRV